jgi:hypothetical protein
MSYAESLLPEFDQEMANTRKVLERLPDDKLDWKAHSKSHTIGWNANHVVDMVNWIVAVITTPSLGYCANRRVTLSGPGPCRPTGNSGAV